MKWGARLRRYVQNNMLVVDRETRKKKERSLKNRLISNVSSVVKSDKSVSVN